ncbi:hypothetical protein [Mycobacterium szulgai]|uniref:Uncharacterized protein n=1 Tax=Mycobacterium szulgai TaxID=1787 RepID=A0A1X2DLU8_MYCSZ|nr:hypothetical protein [Mycobacterium szulgai]ORW89111.1 hypothetical protein AWC27_13460 [Mycobacterium szulgai]
MVGDGPATTVCKAGFYIDYPDPNLAGQRLPGFVTAAQCAQGGMHAPVAVMKGEGGQQNPTRIKIGEITYLAPGDTRPAIAGEPWTAPNSSLAVFSSGRVDWAMPVGFMVNDQQPTNEITQSARPVEQLKAAAQWSNAFGVVTTGRVLDPASTPELKDIPSSVSRAVVAADDKTQPIEEWVRGSPVTVEINGATYNLGIITSIDESRHWIVVDLLAPMLADQGARLITTS